ncbi:MAG: hypothetical protein LBR25_04075 [Erysipelotrichaceae bacterium]|jgi:hypothetical protein|nr:hypothetical protein [Erysipelotrichaceae bacterium]
MKKLFGLLLILSCLLAGCDNYTSSAPVRYRKAFSQGSFSPDGQSYINEYLGLTYHLPYGYHFLSPEEVDTLVKQASTVTKSLYDFTSNQQLAVPLFIVDHEEGAQNLAAFYLDTGSLSLDRQAYVTSLIRQLESAYTENFRLRSNTDETIQIGELQFVAVSFTVRYNYRYVYQRYYISVNSGWILIFSLTNGSGFDMMDEMVGVLKIEAVTPFNDLIQGNSD